MVYSWDLPEALWFTTKTWDLVLRTIFLFFSFLTKASNGTNEEVDAKKRNQLISLFMRWLFPETHGEIYFEYGREDHSWDMRDLLMEPEHSNAYLMGFQKLFSLSNNTDSYIQIMGELTKLDANLTTIIREKPQYFFNYNSSLLVWASFGKTWLHS